MKYLLLLALSCATQEHKVSEEKPAEVSKADPCKNTGVQLIGFDVVTESDNMAIRVASVSCEKKYGKCLVKFTKLGPDNYRAICGEPAKKGEKK